MREAAAVARGGEGPQWGKTGSSRFQHELPFSADSSRSVALLNGTGDIRPECVRAPVRYRPSSE